MAIDATESGLLGANHSLFQNSHIGFALSGHQSFCSYSYEESMRTNVKVLNSGIIRTMQHIISVL